VLGSPRVARGVMGGGSGEGSLGVSSNEAGHPIQVRLNTCSDQSQVQPWRQFPGTLVEVVLPAVCGQIKDPPTPAWLLFSAVHLRSGHPI
jgi:hypothetical protein